MFNAIGRAIDMRGCEVRILEEVMFPEPVISHHRRRFDLPSIGEPPAIPIDLNHLAGPTRDSKKPQEATPGPRPVDHQGVGIDRGGSRDFSALQHRTKKVITADGAPQRSTQRPPRD